MIRRNVWAGAIALAAAGCGAPEVTTVAPPGAQIEYTVPEGQASEALGESAGAVQAATKPLANIEAAQPTKVGEAATTKSELKYETLNPGNGPEAKPGQMATVHYTGTLTDGTKFDSSRDRGKPFSFRLGGGGVIQGWEQGVVGMKVGERRKLTIPPELGYGKRGNPPAIPADATLIFDIELVKVE